MSLNRPILQINPNQKLLNTTTQTHSPFIQTSQTPQANNSLNQTSVIPKNNFIPLSTPQVMYGTSANNNSRLAKIILGVSVVSIIGLLYSLKKGKVQTPTGKEVEIIRPETPPVLPPAQNPPKVKQEGAFSKKFKDFKTGVQNFKREKIDKTRRQIQDTTQAIKQNKQEEKALERRIQALTQQIQDLEAQGAQKIEEATTLGTQRIENASNTAVSNFDVLSQQKSTALEQKASQINEQIDDAVSNMQRTSGDTISTIEARANEATSFVDNAKTSAVSTFENKANEALRTVQDVSNTVEAKASEVIETVETASGDTISEMNKKLNETTTSVRNIAESSVDSIRKETKKGKKQIQKKASRVSSRLDKWFEKFVKQNEEAMQEKSQRIYNKTTRKLRGEARRIKNGKAIEQIATPKAAPKATSQIVQPQIVQPKAVQPKTVQQTATIPKPPTLAEKEIEMRNGIFDKVFGIFKRKGSSAEAKIQKTISQPNHPKYTVVTAPKIKEKLNTQIPKTPQENITPVETIIETPVKTFETSIIQTTEDISDTVSKVLQESNTPEAPVLKTADETSDAVSKLKEEITPSKESSAKRPFISAAGSNRLKGIFQKQMNNGTDIRINLVNKKIIKSSRFQKKGITSKYSFIKTYTRDRVDLGRGKFQDVLSVFKTDGPKSLSGKRTVISKTKSAKNDKILKYQASFFDVNLDHQNQNNRIEIETRRVVTQNGITTIYDIGEDIKRIIEESGGEFSIEKIMEHAKNGFNCSVKRIDGNRKGGFETLPGMKIQLDSVVTKPTAKQDQSVLPEIVLKTFCIDEEKVYTDGMLNAIFGEGQIQQKQPSRLPIAN